MSTIKKNTITIFLASSDELINDRNSFQALISSLDDIYESRGIRVKCKRWEDFVAYCTGERTQDDYNKVLSNSDICICMFHRKAGMYTIEEFNHAMAEYKRTKNHPKTYVYARAVVDGEIEDDELKQFKADLFKQMGHYWCNYQTDDAMKLHFIMQFERLLSNNILPNHEQNIKIEQGNVLLHGKKVADVSQIPFISDNTEFQALKDKVEVLNKDIIGIDKTIADFLELVADDNHPKIKEKRVERNNKCTERNECQKQLEQLEKQLLDMAMSINKMISSDNPISERKRAAIEMFEKGNNRGVLEILNEQDIENDYQHARSQITSGEKLKATGETLIDNGEQKIHSLIEECIMKADTWMTTYTSPNRFAEACKMYEKTITMAQESLHEKDLAKQLFNYAYFLQENNQFNLAIDCYGEALKMLEELVKENPEAYMPNVAMSLNNLANLYSNTQRFNDAETYHLRALEIYERLSQANPETYESYLARPLTNLGHLYFATRRFDDSETYYLRALEIIERLSQNNPEAYEPDLAWSLSNLGRLYFVTKCFDDSETYYLRALEIRERLSQANPEAYEPDLAGSLNNLGLLYSKTQRFSDSETYHLRALEIYERLSQANPEAYEPDLAGSLNNLGLLFCKTQRFSDSETYHLRALDIYERLSQANPETYAPYLARSLNNLGRLYFATKRFDDSETYYLRALDIYERLSKQKSSFYDLNIVRILNSLSYILLFSSKYSESAEYAQKALSIYPENLMPYTNLAASLLLQGRFEEAKELYLKYKDELKDGFLSDFEEFKVNNIIPQERLDDVEKIIELLK